LDINKYVAIIVLRIAEEAGSRGQCLPDRGFFFAEKVNLRQASMLRIGNVRTRKAHTQKSAECGYRLPHTLPSPQVRNQIEDVALDKITGWWEDLAKSIHKNNPILTARR
jgi:hypothetical protein